MLVSNVQGIAQDEYEGSAGSSLGEDEKKETILFFSKSEEELP